MMRKSIITFFLVLFLAGCSSDEPGDKDDIRRPIELSRWQQELVTSQNEFAVRLFSKSLRRGNSVISPLSVSMGMSMAANGASGATYSEISEALGYNGAPIEEVNLLNQTLLQRLPVADGNTDLAIANSMWINDGFNVLKSFRTNMADYYESVSENVNLASGKSVDRINGWLSGQTHGKMGNLLTRPTGGEVVLVNSMYFKSIWAAPFPKDRTKAEEFYNESGSSSTVKMMFSNERHRGFMYDGATVVRMRYGNGAYHFTAILPPEDMKISDYLSTLSGSVLMEWEEILRWSYPDVIRSIKVGMPRFSTTSDYDLIPILKELGIREAFTPLADFSLLSDHSLMLTNVMQRATIEVDEEGVVATAATVVVGGDTASVPIPIEVEEVKFDRPFLYYISEYSTGAILFMGNVSEL